MNERSETCKDLVRIMHVLRRHHEIKGRAAFHEDLPAAVIDIAPWGFELDLLDAVFVGKGPIEFPLHDLEKIETADDGEEKKPNSKKDVTKSRFDVMRVFLCKFHKKVMTIPLA